MYIYANRKHFPWEDYDEWLFGETGLWNGETRHPDVLVLHLGLHTCVHAWHSPQMQNNTMIEQHKNGLRILMENVRKAIDRNHSHMPRTKVIIQLAGRAGSSDPNIDHCSRTMNRVAAYEGHRQGFAAFEREEIERRLLYKSEYYRDVSFIKPLLHLESPAANIIGTSLVALIACLQRNGTEYNLRYRPADV